MAKLSAVVIGAGFSGLAAAIYLKRAGIHDFVILEKANAIGGTWRDNTYPGAACDVPSHLYSFSFEPNPTWSRAYGTQPEILAYLEHCVAKYGLGPHLRFGNTVDGAEFDERTGTWRVTTAVGEVFEARALVLGNGALHIPQLPDIAGLDTFRGRQFHSARWDHDFDFRGKRVAVIGTGASAIQFVPEIAPLVSQLHLFQRTPPWIVPKRDHEIPKRERWAYAHVPGAHWLRRTSLYWRMEAGVVGFAYAPKVNRFMERLVLGHLASQVRDRELRKKLTPRYRFGCKRVLISNDYYPALQRDNVELVTEPIAEIVPTGVRTNDRIHEVDAIVCGTGFRVTDYLSPIRIVGRGGAELNATWREQMRNYLGITVSGFPNLFLLMGPNTGLGHNSMIFMIEAQARYTMQSIRELRDRNLAYIDVKPSVEEAFRTELAARMKNTVWMTGCRSWYQTPEGEVFLWPAATLDYWWRTRRLDLDDYDVAA
jgi:cation diffusion facilitator CzcD-associated flavoprotein CzcO